MTDGKEGSSSQPEGLGRLTVGSVWKGENESDPEQVESGDRNSLADASVWTEDEAFSLYREKLVKLRELYVGQLSRLRHVLQERRRQFLLEWQAEGGSREQAIQLSQGGSHEDAAYRCYRKRSGEEALLERKRKLRRVTASLELFSRREARENNKTHHQYLTRLQQQLSQGPSPTCGTSGCENSTLLFAGRCLKHICNDPKQLLYTNCAYTYPSGDGCSNPITLYAEPPLCGAHCDNAELSEAPVASGGSTEESGTFKCASGADETAASEERSKEDWQRGIGGAEEKSGGEVGVKVEEVPVLDACAEESSECLGVGAHEEEKVQR